MIDDIFATDNEFLRLTEEAYHNDPFEVPTLNQSVATVLIKKSPRHAHAIHPKLGGGKFKHSTEFDKGTAIHTFLLRKGRGVVSVPHADWRTNAAKALRDEIRARNEVPLLEHQYESVSIAAERIRKNLAELDIVFDGEAELAMKWREGDTLCRGMMDHLKIDEGSKTAIIDDLKSTKSAHPSDVQRSVENYGYDIQCAAYLSGVQTIRPDLESRVLYRWIFFELEPPYIVQTYTPSGSYIQLGWQRWKYACEEWSNCLQSGLWPGYSNNQTLVVNPPDWVLRSEMFRGRGSQEEEE